MKATLFFYCLERKIEFSIQASVAKQMTWTIFRKLKNKHWQSYIGTCYATIYFMRKKITSLFLSHIQTIRAPLKYQNLRIFSFQTIQTTMSSRVASVLALALGCFHILEPCPNYQRITHHTLNLISIVILLVVKTMKHIISDLSNYFIFNINKPPF